MQHDHKVTTADRSRFISGLGLLLRVLLEALLVVGKFVDPIPVSPATVTTPLASTESALAESMPLPPKKVE